MAVKKTYPSDKQDQYIVRFPDGMRDQLKNEAAANGRSMNAEIVARLGWSLEGNLSDLSAEGFGALIKRLEATVETAEYFLFDVRDMNPALEQYMVENGIDRKHAIHTILKDWLAQKGYGKID
ncbi:Arc-like DNA binding dprotein [Agrobacterium vitis]|nr:Arc-like DNA binding dprotein [Agrobacterium vitis]